MRPLPSITAIALAITMFAGRAAFAEDDFSRIAPRVPPWTIPLTVTRGNISGGTPILEGKFQIGTTVRDAPLATCAYVIPMAGDVPAPTAPDIVLRFGWLGEECLAAGGRSRTLATHLGFSVLTINWPRQNMKGPQDRGVTVFPESGSGAAWVRALECLRIIGRLPARKVFVLGFSAGGSAAHQFAEAFPREVEAAVVMGGRTFVEYPQFSGPTLLMHSSRDRLDANNALASSLKALGAPLLHVTFTPDWAGKGKREYWEHNSSGDAWNLADKWLVALADQRLKNNGKLTPVAQWPTVDGYRVPSAECAPALKAMLDSTLMVKNQNLGDGLIVTKPNNENDAKGTVMLIDRRFASNLDNVLAPAELLANRGYLCQGALCDEAPMSDGSKREFFAKRLRLQSPVQLALIGSDGSDSSLVANIPTFVTKLILVNPRLDDLRALVNAARKRNIDTRVLLSESDSSPDPELGRLGVSIAHAPTESLGDYYSALVEYIISPDAKRSPK